MWMLLILGVLVLAGGGGKKANAILAHTVATTQPPPPMDGDEFRSGAQPDPEAPDDPNRGRVFQFLGHSLQPGNVSKHDLKIATFDADAKGEIVVTLWANRAGMPDKCAAFRFRMRVDQGRAVLPAQSIGGVGCPAGSAPLLQGVPSTGPQLTFENRGTELWLLWRVRSTTKEDQGFEDGEAIGFYVDILWRFEA